LRFRSSRAFALLVVVGLLASACTGASRPDEGGEVIASEPTPGTDASVAPTATSDATPGSQGSTGGGGPSAGSVEPPPAGAPLPISPPVKQTGPRLYDAANDKVGITKDKLVFCAHAALTYAAAFNTSADDLNVYWQDLNSKGGVYGRKVEVTYENDNYSGPDAIAAAEKCKAKKPAFIIGGIGFDQIPSVRDWAEKNKYMYVHHTATVQGTAGKKYSFTGLPSVEKAGEMFAELAISKFKGKKIGILGRDSLNWMPGVQAFDRLAKGKLNIVKRIYTPKDHHNYSLELGELRRAGAEVVWSWESALAAVEMVQQAKGIGWSPTWMVFPFNLQSQTLGQQALNPKMYGVAVWNAFSYGDYSGPFAAYAADMKEFQRQYAKWRPDADIKGVGGDLLFLNWQGMKSLHALLQACGQDCTRNRMADVIRGSKYPRSGAVCGVDFTRPGAPNRGGYQVSTMETYTSPSGQVNWRNIQTCKEHLI
jgi:ABC-type branched-subunit amino acid transport system substrate-binding protein